MLLLDHEFRLPHKSNQMLSLDFLFQPHLLSIHNDCLVSLSIDCQFNRTAKNYNENYVCKMWYFLILMFLLCRHVTIMCQGAKSYKKKFPVSKALSSLQTMAESSWMLLLQCYILTNLWGSYPTIPIGGFINMG